MFLLWVIWWNTTPYFYECTHAQNLWNQLWLYLSEKVTLPVLNPQSAIFGFTDVLDHDYLHLLSHLNHLLLIFKYNIYNSRVSNTLSFQSLKCVASQIKYIEDTISNNDLNKINWSSLLVTKKFWEYKNRC